jgi:hypothetical protein
MIQNTPDLVRELINGTVESLEEGDLDMAEFGLITINDILDLLEGAAA